MVFQTISVLSIKQPHADHIIFGDKWCENRTWQTRYRGPLFIHASQWTDQATNRLRVGVSWVRSSAELTSLMSSISNVSTLRFRAYKVGDKARSLDRDIQHGTRLWPRLFSADKPEGPGPPDSVRCQTEHLEQGGRGESVEIRPARNHEESSKPASQEVAADDDWRRNPRKL